MDASAQQGVEEKAVEVENVLVAKLEASIHGNTPWSSSFSDCKELLKTKLDKEPHPDRKFRARFRRKVHHLNDLVAEHHSVLANANLYFAYRLSQIKKEIRTVLKADSAAAPAGKVPLIERQTERVPSRPSPIVSHGLEVDQMAVENLLLCRDPSPEFNAVGIYGAEGVGKTTLALVIFHCDKVKSRYLPRIWICLTDRRESESADIEIFVAKRILLHLGIDPDKIEAGEGLKRAIHRELKWKKYLVVLDGVSEEMEAAQMKRVMAMLRDALPKGMGGAVVVTGRAETMVKAMVGDDNGVYQLHPLDKQEKCWNVFMAATENQEDGGIGDRDERQKVKNEVVKRSHGLPWSSTLLGVIRREIVENPRPSQQTDIQTDGDKGQEMNNDEGVKRSHGHQWWNALFKSSQQHRPQQLQQV